MTESIQQVKQSLDELVRYEVEDKQIPSISYVIVDGTEIALANHISLADIPRSKSLSDETVFRVGSCSKMLTAIALMQLAEEGKVDLDADVAEYVPGFRPKNPFLSPDETGDKEARITLRKVMSHTAGLIREPALGHYLDDRAVTLERAVSSIKDSVLKEDPRNGVFRYSNAGFAVVGYVVERVTGEEFSDYIQKNLLDRIGMHLSGFRRSERIEAHLAPARMWSVEQDIPAPVFDMGVGPAGNLFSTLPDMAEFVKVLLRGGYTSDGQLAIKPVTLHQMWKPIGFRGKMGYGLGFGIGSLDGWKTIGHGGAVYGFSTQCVVLPEAQLGAVLFSTLDASNAIISRIGAYALRLILASKGMGSTPSSPSRPRALTPAQIAFCVGHYHSQQKKETIIVKEKEGKLYLLGDGLPLRIQPLSDLEFIVDGRVFGPGSEYPHLHVSFALAPDSSLPAPALTWQETVWKRIPGPLPQEKVPPEFHPYLGEYGPDFNVTQLFYQGGQPRCLIEYFYTHSLEKIRDGVYKMHGMLYEDEILRLDARDENGQQGIMVGSMFLKRRS